MRSRNLHGRLEGRRRAVFAGSGEQRAYKMKQAERKQAYIVGIAGESAGGKSTLADSLEKGLAGYKVKMFHLDEYFKEAEERPVIQGFLDGKMYRDDNHPDTLKWSRFHGDLEKAAGEACS